MLMTLGTVLERDRAFIKYPSRDLAEMLAKALTGVITANDKSGLCLWTSLWPGDALRLYKQWVIFSPLPLRCVPFVSANTGPCLFSVTASCGCPPVPVLPGALPAQPGHSPQCGSHHWDREQPASPHIVSLTFESFLLFLLSLLMKNPWWQKANKPLTRFLL